MTRLVTETVQKTCAHCGKLFPRRVDAHDCCPHGMPYRYPDSCYDCDIEEVETPRK